MWPRGRLINVFLAELYRLDTQATDGVAGAGYDDVFDEPLPVDDGTQTGAPSRREHAAIDVPCQVDRRDYESDELALGGHAPETTLILTFHFRDLEDYGLVHSDPSLAGKPMIGPGDRVGSLKKDDGALVRLFPDPPGLYVVEAEEGGWGLNHAGTSERNLLIAKLEPRRPAR